MLVADHSTAGAIIGGSLRQAGFQGAVRYAAAGRGNVNITAAEYHDLQANGISVAIVCEHEAEWLIAPGITQRVKDSIAVARAAGIPDGVTYLACDFDVTNGGPTAPGSKGERQMQAVRASIVAALPLGEIGFYGSYYAIDWLENHGIHLPYYWQTAAWSHGQLHPKACLFQRAQSQHVAGVDVDINDILKPDWGARQKLPPPPTPKPTPKPWCDYTLLTGVEKTIVLRYDSAVKQPKANQLALVGLRAQLKFLAGLVWTAAHTSRPAAWGKRNRGTRYQMLARRGQGQRLG
jgi:hypothetical protein